MKDIHLDEYILEQFMDEDFSNPLLQLQPKEPSSSMQMAFSPHMPGDNVHSSTSVEQLCPVQPALQ